MPFVSISRPAIGISLLKARLASEGIEAKTGYANLIFAEMTGTENYSLVDEKINLTLFPGDWLFAQFMFEHRLDINTYIATLQCHLDNQEQMDAFLNMRTIIAPFMQECMKRLDVKKYDIIGFTSTFQQNMPSLAMARMIKQTYPDKIVVFGGANCEGDMGVELHRSFRWIDYVCTGEADYSFPKLVKKISSGKSIKDVRGIVCREAGHTMYTGPSVPVMEMDRLPCPDYEDYFSALENSPVGGTISPTLPVEFSRGCWWGARSQCTFCGLNGETITFRSKSSARVFSELACLRKRYGINSFTAVDNVMDMNYFSELLPALKRDQSEISMFYEVRSTLDRDQVKLLREAGVHAVQPGIESLSTAVLKLMRKGVTALQNVAFLKWCSQYGVTPAWNLLYGFPGESAEDYEYMSEIIDSISHLPPPYSTGGMRLDRFSPYFKNPERFGITGISPFFTYNLIYPVPSRSITNLAYFFQYEQEEANTKTPYIEKLLKKVESWKQGESGQLIKQYGNNPEMLITDTRPGRVQDQIALNGIQREVYDYCDIAKSFKSILTYANSRCGSRFHVAAWLPQFLNQMVDWRLMIREKSFYLNLSVEQTLPTCPVHLTT